MKTCLALLGAVWLAVSAAPAATDGVVRTQGVYRDRIADYLAVHIDSVVVQSGMPHAKAAKDAKVRREGDLKPGSYAVEIKGDGNVFQSKQQGKKLSLQDTFTLRKFGDVFTINFGPKTPQRWIITNLWLIKVSGDRVEFGYRVYQLKGKAFQIDEGAVFFNVSSMLHTKM